MTWDELVDAVTARHPDVAPGKMFEMLCLKKADGKVVAALWRGGGISVKIVDEAVRAQALLIPGVGPASHAFDPGRRMREWVHVSTDRAGEWERLVECALT
jgi:hypothetical protein